ncbi:hypothetical protein LF95_17545 [Thalassospira sp. TSL5-1]|nr:hypothetical protein LF95_17545 [Thalassospira sp. TSL5-1]
MQGPVIVASVVFALSLLGILTRPEHMLAALWPANAILSAILVRNPRFNTLLGWLAACMGYVAADYITGSTPWVSLLLALANLCGVMVALMMLRRLCFEDISLLRPRSIGRLGIISFLSSIASGSVGAVVSGLYFGTEPVMGFLFWSSAEFANFVVILPFALTVSLRFAVLNDIVAMWRDAASGWEKVKPYMPVLAVLASLLLVQFVGGPGAIVFPVPALLWCALVYRLQVTAFIVFLVSQSLIYVLEFNLVFNLPAHMDAYWAVVSTRLGIALLAIGPLTVASINAARTVLLRQLDHAANHDFLTGLLSRRAFVTQGNELVDRLGVQQDRLSVVLIDIDHFKQINDSYGHATGDFVLAEVAEVIRQHLQENDLIGRLGGEEFAVLLPHISPQAAEDVAQKIRNAIAGAQIFGMGSMADTRIFITISAGVISRNLTSFSNLDQLILEADKLMYEAKRAGRNRVLIA